MFNKSFLFVLAILAFGWIGYVGFTLIQGTAHPPLPETCFNSSDGTILIIHKPLEIDYTDTNLTALQGSSFLMQVISKPERIQHFYMNASLDKVLLERSKPWTVELISNYFNQLQLSIDISSDKSFKLSNDWSGCFHGKFLLITSTGFVPSETRTKQGWNYVDRKASFTNMTFSADNGYQLKNNYCIQNNKTSYYATSNTNSFPLVDDQEVFQEIIPSNLSNYRFFQKDFALFVDQHESVAYQWMEYGVALLISNKDTCLISDFKAGQDPISILEELPNFDKTSAHRGTLKNTKIPFLKKNATLHVEVFNNYVLLSRNSNLINQIIGNYETGNTLAQAHVKRAHLFAKLPKKVNYRYISNDVHETKSYLEGAICQFKQGTSNNQESSDKLSDVVNPFSPLRLDGNLVYITEIPGSDRLLVTTSSNSIYSIGRNRIEWSKTLESTIQSKPIVVGNSVYLATSEGIEAYAMNGETKPNFPIATGNTVSNLFDYLWKGQTFIAFATDREVSAINLDGKVQFKLNAGSKQILEVAVQGKKGELVVHAVGPTSWQQFNVNRKRRIKEFRITEGSWRLNKVNQEISIIGVSKNKLIRINDQNQQSMLIGNCSKLLRVQNFQNDRIQIAVQNKTAYMVQSNGGLLGQFTTNLNEIEDAALFKLPNGKTIVGIIDGISNNCYIYRLNGNELNKENYEGSNRIVFQRLLDGTIVLVSQSNGYLIRYPLNL